MVKIKGITQKGKNRVREHGDTWEIMKRQNGNILLRANDGYLKWLNPDFKIME